LHLHLHQQIRRLQEHHLLEQLQQQKQRQKHRQKQQ